MRNWRLGCIFRLLTSKLAAMPRFSLAHAKNVLNLLLYKLCAHMPFRLNLIKLRFDEVVEPRTCDLYALVTEHTLWEPMPGLTKRRPRRISEARATRDSRSEGMQGGGAIRCKRERGGGGGGRGVVLLEGVAAQQYGAMTTTQQVQCEVREGTMLGGEGKRLWEVRE